MTRHQSLPGWVREILELVEDGYQGKIILHVDGNGNVPKYTTNQTHTPTQGKAHLSEVNGPRRR